MSMRVVTLSDTHCGHVAGLTPPQWQFGADDPYEEKYHLGQWQRWLWEYYTSLVDALAPIDVLLVLGDLIEGKGKHNRGVEVQWADRNDQVKMAVEIVKRAAAKTVVMVTGTPSHVGKGENFEQTIAERVGAKRVGHHLSVEVSGVVFDLKHKVGRSKSLNGKKTALSRHQVANRLLAVREAEPLADIVLRAHAHYYHAIHDSMGAAMINPCMQGSTKFGAQEGEGEVDIGLLQFDIEGKGEWTWKAHTRTLSLGADYIVVV